MRALILGAGGQVGRALATALPEATALGRHELDIVDAAAARLDWSSYEVVINAAAYTNVDGAENSDERPTAWRANAEGPAALASVAREHRLTLVHLSSEYVFDGRRAEPYHEKCPFAPLSSYGASKVAGDVAVRTLPAHYVVRPSWVVGDGRNFVRTMLGLATKGVSPTVVADQVGRPTFAPDIADAIVALVTMGAPYGTYHITSSGEATSWAEVARMTFALAGRSDLTVRETTTAAYFADKPTAARRPLNGMLNLSKAENAGVRPPDWQRRLAEYVSEARTARP